MIQLTRSCYFKVKKNRVAILVAHGFLFIYLKQSLAGST